VTRIAPHENRTDGTPDGFPAAAADPAGGLPPTHDLIGWTRRRLEASDAPRATHFAAMTAILRTSGAIAAEVEAALRPHDMTLRTYWLLVTLQVAPERTRTLGQLSRALLVHPTTVTLAVDQLEAAGLVRRVRHATDRRTVLAILTDDGLRAVEGAGGTLARIDFGLRGASTATAERLIDDLWDVRSALGDRD
jgi:DNA-binding MarR family transcriptional regulator